MDIMTFIASLVESLAWPTILIVSLFYLRKPISQLLPFLSRVKYGDVEVEFSNKIESLKSEVDNRLIKPGNDINSTTMFVLKYMNMARKNSKGTILEASKNIDSILLGTAMKKGVAAPAVKGLFEGVLALNNLEKKGLIPKDVSLLFRRLLDIRNSEFGQAATDKDLALDFIYTAARLIAYLEEQ